MKSVNMTRDILRRIGGVALFLSGIGGGFAFGALYYAQRANVPPMVVHAAVDVPDCRVTNPIGDGRQLHHSLPDSRTCAFVGSKNSTKYYPPTCRFARRIKPENLRCFVTEQSARDAGYVPATGC